jgi:lysophospholipase L1-like esterase
MYRFQVIAPTQVGDSIYICGSTPLLGDWQVSQAIPLQTNRDRYPTWWVDLDIPPTDKLEYKYFRRTAQNLIQWEATEPNRWLPRESEPLSTTLVIDDGHFGQIQPYPYSYFLHPLPETPHNTSSQGIKVLVVGSSVAMGCSAWRLQGWAWHLEQALKSRYDARLLNRSILGANTGKIKSILPPLLTVEKPDFVIISLSLGNEGLPYSHPRDHIFIQERFEKGLQALLEMTRATGAKPILGGVYPHATYTPEQTAILRQTQERMQRWDVPLLDWFSVLEDGQGRWRTGISFDLAHPNSLGHQLMYEAINLRLFEPDNAPTTTIYFDAQGFSLASNRTNHTLEVSNPSPYTYHLSPTWRALSTQMQQVPIPSGIYLADKVSFFVGSEGKIDTNAPIPPREKLVFQQQSWPLLFEAGDLKIFQPTAHQVAIVNTSAHEYNIQPMWTEVQVALKVLESGVHEDLDHPDTPFRTLMIGDLGLESRVKIPPHTLLYFGYRCPLSAIQRVGIIPIGDRCAVRMLLYKLGLDGPAFPFDLTRTTYLSDIADMITQDFADMWNPRLLHYHPEEKRIYHGKWSGLSFAHEVEETENPLEDMSPIFERMKSRYSARAARFRYVIQHSDRLLFVRTGGFDRGSVIDLLAQLERKCGEKPFQLLILSAQSGEEIADLAGVIYYCVEFNPDAMYANHDYWFYCSQVMGEILAEMGISSKNLFWCPPRVSA